MEKEQKLGNYESPKVEVVEVEIEKGFALSSDSNGQNMNPKPGSW